MKRKILIILIIVFGLISIIGGLFLNQELKEKPSKKTEKEDDMYVLIKKTDNIENIFLEKFPINDVNTIDNQDKLSFAFNILKQQEKTTFKKEEVSKVFTEYFGTNFTYQDEDLVDKKTNEVLYKYEKKSKKYIYKNSLTNNFNSDYQLMSSTSQTKKNGKYLIEKKYLFIDILNTPYTLYATYQDYLNKTNLLGTYTSTNPSNLIDSTIIRKYQDSLKTVTFTFEQENDHYILKSVI